MLEKELELVTLDNITLGSYYVESSKKTKDSDNWYKRYDVVIVPAFSDRQEQKACYNENGNPTTPKLDKTFKTLGTEVTVDVLSNLDYSSNTLLSRIEEENPKVAEVLKKRISKNYFDKVNEEAIKSREDYKDKVQKQYDELLKLYTEYGTKSDLATMSDINDLYYCEAEGYMKKLEERINKKANPKNLKLYKQLQNIRGKRIITCNEG